MQAATDQTIDLPSCLKLVEELPIFGFQLEASLETTARRNIWTVYFFYICVSTWCFALLDMFCCRGSWLMSTSCKRNSLLHDGINFNIEGGLPREVLFHLEWAMRSWLSLVLAVGQFRSLDIVSFSDYAYFVQRRRLRLAQMIRPLREEFDGKWPIVIIDKFSWLGSLSCPGTEQWGEE